MTAGEAAAQIAAQSAAAQAAYQVGTLGPTAGVSGMYQSPAAMAAAWDAQPPSPGGLIAGGGNTAIMATGLQAGYYQVPGQPGAEYYDPSSGQASAEFVAWANGATQEELSAAFIPVEGGPEATVQAGQLSGQALVDFNAEAALINAGDTNQQAQDIVLAQKFVTGANDQQENMAQSMAPQTGGGYRDISPSADTIPGGFLGVGGTFGYWEQVAGGSTWVSTATEADFAANESDAAANAVNINEQNQTAAYALQQENVIAAAEAAGVDPGSALVYGTGLPDIANIAETGISTAQTAAMTATYDSIQDPVEQAAWIAAQDPGNLTASLRAARMAARNAVGDNVDALLGATETYQSAESFGAPDGTEGSVETTYGDITQTNEVTGRSIMFGNVATAIQYIAPTDNAFGKAMDRLGGALYGGIMGYIGSFGNPAGAIIGAAAGSGLTGGIKVSLKNPVGNIGKSTWGAAETPGSIGSVVLSLGEAMAFSYFGVGNMGPLAKTAIGAGLGTVNGFLSGGMQGAEFGGGVGAFGGRFAGSNGPSYADAAQNAYQGF